MILTTNLDLDAVRRRILSGLCVSALIVAMPDFISNLAFGHGLGVAALIALQTLCLLSIPFLMLRAKSLSLSAFSTILQLQYFILGTTAYLAYGTGNIGMILLLGVIPSTMMMKKQVSYLYILGCTLTIALIGVLSPKGMVRNMTFAVSDDHLIYHWLIRAFVMAVYLTILHVSVRLLRSYLEHSIARLTENNLHLQSASDALAASEEEIRHSYDRLEKAAFSDDLTGLPNQTRFKSRVQQAIDDRPEHEFTLLYIDLDDFKKINDLFGREHGDRVLQAVAETYGKDLMDGDVLARLHADEFMLFVQSEHIPAEIRENLDKLSDQLLFTVEINGILHEITSSVGIAQYPAHGNTAVELIKNAEIAMREGKRMGKRQFARFSPQMIADIEKRHAMERELRDMIQIGSIELVYQPRINIRDCRIMGVEALSRWKSSQFGFVSPDVFIPLLEESGLIVPYGKLCLEHALMMQKEIHDATGRDLVMSVNISPIQFEQPDFVDFVKTMLAKYRVKPGSLELEITEGMMIADKAFVNEKLNALSAVDVRIAMDDFGTGYSSLSYLMDLTLHTLKLDKALIDHIETAKAKEKIVSTIIALAHDLNLTVVAEGVELKEQFDLIAHHQGDEVQGYYFHKPMVVADILKLLEE